MVFYWVFIFILLSFLNSLHNQQFSTPEVQIFIQPVLQDVPVLDEVKELRS